MFYDVFSGIMIPFAGTALGALCVFFMKRSLSAASGSIMCGFAAGVMTAASVWSLLIPSAELSAPVMGSLSFIPPAAGFTIGTAFLLLIDRFVPEQVEGAAAGSSGGKMLMFAVTIHNIPEGMAVGAVYAGLICGSSDITAAGAFALALGIAIQNFPEGAVISMPLHAYGMKKGRAFVYGVLSGAVEPLGAALTIAAASLIVPALPYFLGFAAGAMIYVAARELIPQMFSSDSKNVGMISYAFGFVLMMSLDIALG